MKRTIAIFLSALLLTSCGLADSEMGEIESYSGFEIISESRTYSKNFDEIGFTIRNTTDESYSFGEEWELEKNVDGVWKTVPYAHEGWKAIAYVLPPDLDWNITIKSEDWDYSFDEGEYRYYQRFDGEAEAYAVFEFELE